MTPAARSHYFIELWPAAALANEWNVKDDARRRAVTLACMAAIKGPETDSVSKMGEDEITALFTYLRHLADPASLDKSARWVSCQEDYKTFARAKQADFHERSLYGKGKNKLDKNRFKGETSAAGGPLDTLDAEEVRKRHLTMASRNQARLRKEKKDRRAATKEPAIDFDAAPAGTAMPAPAAPMPAHRKTADIEVPF
ncbi:MAG TPA: hypothetical protein VL357_03215 [Rariglobus sp.]|jgi:hypothetical protein|nr:hypothetical protein [Rariglobus sp.]